MWRRTVTAQDDKEASLRALVLSRDDAAAAPGQVILVQVVRHHHCAAALRVAARSARRRGPVRRVAAAVPARPPPRPRPPAELPPSGWCCGCAGAAAAPVVLAAGRRRRQHPPAGWPRCGATAHANCRSQSPGGGRHGTPQRPARRAKLCRPLDGRPRRWWTEGEAEVRGPASSCCAASETPFGAGAAWGCALDGGGNPFCSAWAKLPSRGCHAARLLPASDGAAELGSPPASTSDSLLADPLSVGGRHRRVGTTCRRLLSAVSAASGASCRRVQRWPAAASARKRRPPAAPGSEGRGL